MLCKIRPISNWGKINTFSNNFCSFAIIKSNVNISKNLTFSRIVGTNKYHYIKRTETNFLTIIKFYFIYYNLRSIHFRHISSPFLHPLIL